MTGNPLMDLRRLDEEKRAKTPFNPSNTETNVTTLQDYTVAGKQETQQETQQETHEPSQHVTPEVSTARTQPRSRKSSAVADPTPGTIDGSREERLAAAMQLAQDDEPIVVTIRVSPRLNAYIDRYVQRTNQIEPKRRYRKQDAVAEAFAAFYADHIMPPAPMDEDGL